LKRKEKERDKGKEIQKSKREIKHIDFKAEAREIRWRGGEGRAEKDRVRQECLKRNRTEDATIER
jgi:hypothetical protein